MYWYTYLSIYTGFTYFSHSFIVLLFTLSFILSFLSRLFSVSFSCFQTLTLSLFVIVCVFFMRFLCYQFTHPLSHFLSHFFCTLSIAIVYFYYYPNSFYALSSLPGALYHYPSALDFFCYFSAFDYS